MSMCSCAVHVVLVVNSNQFQILHALTQTTRFYNIPRAQDEVTVDTWGFLTKINHRIVYVHHCLLTWTCVHRVKAWNNNLEAFLSVSIQALEYWLCSKWETCWFLFRTKNTCMKRVLSPPLSALVDIAPSWSITSCRPWCHSHDKCFQPFLLCFCIL